MSELLQPKQKSVQSGIAAHILLWGVIFILPNLVMSTDRIFNWTFFIRSLPEMFGYMFVFYLNFFLLIDKLLYKGKTREFIVYNVLIIVAVAVLMHYGRGWLESVLPELRRHVVRRGGRGGGGRGGREMLIWWFIVRDATMLLLMSGFSVALKMTFRWFQVESERKELIKAKLEAELQNLKNQINPHFLLNTLNNIYALIEFNPPKAQQAVMDLSRMLRHLLYDNDKMFVPLRQEADFMRNYIELMRIRLPHNVKLTTNFSYSDTSGTLISPLIFISLIENAFKHGISGEKPSFIDISLRECPDGKVEFLSRNSYFPKSESDKSGSGIGLELAKKRLELLYPNSYLWSTEIENGVYSTVLVIDTTK
jgi:hypothetical protein